MMQSEWLPVVMEASFNEIYVIDCETLHILHINEAARLILLYTAAELTCRVVSDIWILAVLQASATSHSLHSHHAAPLF